MLVQVNQRSSPIINLIFCKVHYVTASYCFTIHLFNSEWKTMDLIGRIPTILQS